MKPHELKALKVRLAEATQREKSVRANYTTAAQALRNAEQERMNLERELRAAQRTFTVSEHAVLRYAERALGLDVAQITRHLTEQVGPLAERLGNGRFPLGASFTAVVENNTLVTVVPVDNPDPT